MFFFYESLELGNETDTVRFLYKPDSPKQIKTHTEGSLSKSKAVQYAEQSHTVRRAQSDCRLISQQAWLQMDVSSAGLCPPGGAILRVSRGDWLGAGIGGRLLTFRSPELLGNIIGHI